jgi:hypothetical protein
VFVGAIWDDHSGHPRAGAVYEFRLAAFADRFESGDTAAWGGAGVER